MPRKDANWIGFQASDEEKQLLEDYCYLKRLTKTEVLRSLIRDLRAEEGENSHHIIKLQLGKTESQILEDYCTRNKMTKLTVLRRLIGTLQQDQPIPIIMRDSSGWMRIMNPDQPTQEDIEWLNLEPNPNPHRPPYNWGDKKWEGNDRPTATHNDPKVQRWLDSLKTESDVASLRSMAQQMLAIAERLEK